MAVADECPEPYCSASSRYPGSFGRSFPSCKGWFRLVGFRRVRRSQLLGLYFQKDILEETLSHLLLDEIKS